MCGVSGAASKEWPQPATLSSPESPAGPHWACLWLHLQQGCWICRLQPREPNSPHNLSNPDTLPCGYNCVRAAALPNNKYQLQSPWDTALPQPPPPRRPCPEPDAGGHARHACTGGAGSWLRHPRLGTAWAPPAPLRPVPREVPGRRQVTGVMGWGPSVTER